jgi:CheY-like chemotaxis protein
MNRQIASQMLEAAGFKVDTAENGEDAVQRAGQASYHAIFMDLHMPVMDGLTACRQIKALGGDVGRTPIIAMTAATSTDDIAACLAAGMVDHIAKPIQLMTLIAAATNAVPNRAA